jgi:hypothetical protein
MSDEVNKRTGFDRLVLATSRASVAAEARR